MRGFSPSPFSSRFRRGTPPIPRAFTLVELLVVMSLIGLITFMAIPAFRGFGQENVIGAAQRQVQDDLSYTRLQAIRNRAPAYMVFFQPAFEGDEDFSKKLNQSHQTLLTLPQVTDEDRKFRDSALRVFTNTFPQQYAAYAIYTEAAVGEQPGVRRRRYLTEWRSLPEGSIFPTNALQLRLPPFVTGIQNQILFTNLNALEVPFPIGPDRAGDSLKLGTVLLPAIGFDSQGRLFNFGKDGKPKGNGTTLADRFVAVGIGSAVLPRKSALGQTNQFDFFGIADVVETPRQNYTNHILRISALTGRVKYLKPPQP